MNIAVIYAGGTGQRMNSKSRPKQFLYVQGKPILIHTLEHFQIHPMIDVIVLVCLKDWIDYCEKILTKYGITKVKKIIPGGETRQESIFYGLKAAYEICQEKDCIVIQNDAVRPLINTELITKCIEQVKEKGSAITVARGTERIFKNSTNGEIESIVLTPEKYRMARAPQCFYLTEIYDCYIKYKSENKKNFASDSVDSIYLMQHYGYKLNVIEGPNENIKITTPLDFYIFKAILDFRENLQIVGL